MRLAIISDIHANKPALQACLAMAERFQAERYIFLGDQVGYGPYPEETIELVRQHVARGAYCIKGNHDEAIDLAAPQMNETARSAIDWTRPRLSEASRNFLKELPLSLSLQNWLFVHADASAPDEWRYINGVDEARASLAGTHAMITFCGHVHVPALYCVSATAKIIRHTPATDASIPLASHRRWLAVMGSAGQPRDGNPAAAFAIFDTANSTLTYHRAPYDVDSVVRKIRQSGLPDSLATRLVTGY